MHIARRVEGGREALRSKKKQAPAEKWRRISRATNREKNQGSECGQIEKSRDRAIRFPKVTEADKEGERARTGLKYEGLQGKHDPGSSGPGERHQGGRAQEVSRQIGSKAALEEQEK